MIISVASGKGGTGKTTIATSLAISIDGSVQLLDCDAEEPNAHIFLRPKIESIEKVFIPIPEVDQEKCSYCGKCRDVCAYNAIAVIPKTGNKKGTVLVFPSLCHGCGSCSYLCPEGAIKEINKEIGVVETGSSAEGNIQFIHGRLNIGEAMAPPVIRQIKSHLNSACTAIIDAPPGTSCPVVESVRGSDFCLLVTEPTPFGLNDLTLAVEMLRKLNIPFGVIINRSDIGDNKVDKYCKRENIRILMRIPFKKEIAAAYSKGIPLVIENPVFKQKFNELYKDIKNCRS
jgi:MinD superfamily P-loop ATPase